MDPFQTRPLGDTGLRLPRLGLGGGPLGSLHKQPSDQSAVATIRRSMELGVRYLDTAPLYGWGRSELRFRQALADRPRESYIISTKVGRLLVGNGEIDFKRVSLGDLPTLDWRFDFSRAGILRAYEQSLDRLGLERVDILFLHDPPAEHYQQVIEEAGPTIAELRSQGKVKAIGVGAQDLTLLAAFAREGDFDCFILVYGYTLLKQPALSEFLPLCVEKGISIIATPYAGGALLGEMHEEEQQWIAVPPESRDRVRRLESVCRRHQVPLKAAALQFPSAHPAVVTSLAGPRSIEEQEENVRMMQHEIAPELWDDLRREGLIPVEAPTPKE